MRQTIQADRVNRLAEEALFAVGEQRQLLKKNLRLVHGIGKEFERALSDLDVIARSIAVDAKAAGFTHARPELLDRECSMAPRAQGSRGVTFPHMRAAVAPPTEQVHHACGHACFCHTASRESCSACRTAAFDAAMAARRYEDGLTTEQLLERRA